MSAADVLALRPSRLRRLRRPAPPAPARPGAQPHAVAGLVIAALWILVAIFAPLLAPHDPLRPGLRPSRRRRRAAHLFGTDDLGRDILSRVIAGARHVAAARRADGRRVGHAIGTALGIVAGYVARLGRRADHAPGRSRLLVPGDHPGDGRHRCRSGPSTRNAVLALVLVTWPIYARVVRSLVLSISTAEYVQAYRLHGASAWRGDAPRRCCRTSAAR